jgi:hypothetical protein
MPAVPEAVPERMGRRACLPQVQVHVGMALGLDRAAEHLELTKHLAWCGPGGVKDAFRLLTNTTTQTFSKPGGRHTHGGRASMNSARDTSKRRGQHKTRLNPQAGHNSRQGSGDWKQRRDRYLALAQAEASAGNAVEAENYYQHAEHYFRLMQQGA